MDDESFDASEQWLAAAILRHRMFGEAPPKVARYEVLGRIGRGAFGIVWRGRDPEIERDVAIKVLVRRGASAERADMWREARAMARVTHEGLAAVYDVGLWHGFPYLVMELVDGVTLNGWIERAKPSAGSIVGVIGTVGRGLEAAHRAGVVHRDVKPDNILVGERGQAKLLDFGLGTSSPVGARTREEHQQVDDPQTNPNRGTPRYMAPEQLLGREVSARSDQYALAATLYASIARHLPPRDLQTAAHRPSPEDRHRFEPRVWRAIERALSGAPEDRFPTVDEFVRALEGSTRGMAGRRMRLAALAAVSGTAMVFLVTSLWSRPRCEIPPGVQRLDSGTLPARFEAAIRAAHPNPRERLDRLEARARELGAQWHAAVERGCVSLPTRRCQERAAVMLEEAFAAMEEASPADADALAAMLYELVVPQECAQETRELEPMDARIEQLERNIARVRIANRLGEPGRVETLSTALLERSDLTGDQRMTLLFERATPKLAVKQVDEAEPLLLEALELAKRGGRDRIAVKVMLALTIVYLETGRMKEHQALLSGASVLAHRIPGAAGAEAVVNVTVAEARQRMARGDPQEALALLERARAEVPRAELFGMLDVLLGTTSAAALSDLGEHTRSAQRYAEAVRIMVEHRGEDAVETIMTRYNVAFSLHLAGNHAEARRLNEDVLARLEGLGLLESPIAWLVRELQGALLMASEEYEAALDLRRSLYGARTTHPAATPRDALLARWQLAQTLIATSNEAEAVALLEPLVPSRDDEALDAETLHALIVLVRAYRRRGEVARANTLMQRLMHDPLVDEGTHCEVLVPLWLEEASLAARTGDRAAATVAHARALSCPARSAMTGELQLGGYE